MADKQFNGNGYNFLIDQIDNGATYDLDVTWDALPGTAVTVNIRKRIVGTPTWLGSAGSPASPRALNGIAAGNYEYEAQIFFNDGSPAQTISFIDATVPSTEDMLYIPFENPVKFFRTTRFMLQQAKYFTKRFDDFMFSERGYSWQDESEYCDIWQTSDTVRIQVESVSDPVVLFLVDHDGRKIRTIPAQLKLRNINLENTFAYEMELSLAGLDSGCYYFQLEVGGGLDLQIFISSCQSIYDGQIEGSLLLEYRNSIAKGDVLYETGITFMKRLFGYIGKLEPGAKNEMARDQKWNPVMLNSIPFRSWPIFFGTDYGVPDDIIDLLNRVWGCDDVLVDGDPYGVSDGGKFEFFESDSMYRKRGVKLVVDEGVNRNSKMFSLSNQDTTKRIVWAIFVDPGMLGAIGSDESTDAVKILKKF